MNSVSILGLPLTSIEGGVNANVDMALRIIHNEIGREIVDLIVLPELFTCGYCAHSLVPYAEQVDGPTMEAFAECSRRLNVSIGYGFAEPCDEYHVYNSWALVEPSGARHVYRKTHLHPSGTDARVNEPEFMAPGQALEPFKTSGGIAGIMICYDGCFTEVPRALTMKGADFLVWPTRSGRYLASMSLPQVRALDNSIPVVQVEGGQKGAFMPTESWSIAASARGNVLASEKTDRPFRVRLNCAEGRFLRTSADQGGHSLYCTRRPELYGVIA